MIPAFDKRGNLPPGIHPADLSEIESMFATSPHRRELFNGLKAALIELKKAGCKTVYLNGSFVTEKSAPRDYDGCYDPVGMNPSALDPVFLDVSDLQQGRPKQKAKFRGEMFPASAMADSTRLFVDFFQIDKQSGDAKGIIVIDLGQVS